jgi:hypothetical protein
MRAGLCIAVLALTLGAMGCTGTAPEEDTDKVVENLDPVNGPGRPGVELEELIAAGLNTAGTVAIPDVLGKLTKPEQMDTKKVPSKYYAEVDDEVHDLSYKGLTITARDSAPVIMVEGEDGELQAAENPDSKRRIEALIVSDKVYRTEKGVSVGATLADVKKALGEPAQTNGTTLIYDLGAGHKWFIRTQANKVNTMQWQFEPVVALEGDAPEEEPAEAPAEGAPPAEGG